VDALKDFLPQAQLHIRSSGIKISGMDTSHVGYVDYFLAADDCATINVPAPLVIGINMPILTRTLSAVGAGDRVTISTNKSKEKLVISYTNEKLGRKAVYELNTLELDVDGMEIPDSSYAATVCARTGDIAAAMKEVGNFGDTLQLCLDEDGFHVSTSGDAGRVKQTLEGTDDREMEMTEDKVEAAFGTKYLLQIMKGGSALSTTTKLEFDANQPMRTTFRFGTGSHFLAYLAPKITE